MEQALTGTLFTKAPTFFTGAVTSSKAVSGTLFQKAPTFHNGQLTGSGIGGAAPSTVDGGLRFEAWTLPNVGTFSRKFDLSRWINSYTISHKYGTISDGRFDLPNNFPKLAELMTVDKTDHSNDVGSVVRVLRGTTPIMHYVLKGLDKRWSSDQETLAGLLEGMDYFLDRSRVPNFDSPANPSVEPDWIYGAPSILANTDFENAGATNLLIHVWVEDAVTSGTWTMTFSGQTTDTLNYDVDAPALQTKIEALSNIADISISGVGTESNPWVIEIIDPDGTDFNVSLNTGSLVGGTALMLSQHAGGAGIVDPWTRAFNPVTGLVHGTYTNFDISTAQAHTGTTSLYVKGALGLWPESYPGAQQVVSVTGGRTYRAQVWVRPAATRAYRFVIRTTDETYIGQVEQTLIANVWQQLSFSVTIPEHIRQIIFRVSCISNTDGHEFYLDDALLAPGMDAATYGKIRMDLLLASQAEGTLTWVTPTWTETHDSAGVIWDRDLEWSVKRGQTHLQLVEYADRWQYESEIRWSEANQQFEWDLFNPSAGGANKLGSGLAIVGRTISGTTTIQERIPEGTFYHTEGDKGAWGEYEDATLVGPWGRLEKYYANAQGLDEPGLLELATRLVETAANETAGLMTRIQISNAEPWTHYRPGDRNVMVNLEPARTRESLRCMAIVAMKNPDDATPIYDVHWDSVVYQGQAAVLEQVRRLYRKFEALRPPAAVDGTPAVPIPPPSPAVAATEVIIAAFDTHDDLKAMAHYVCTGANDEVTWRQMIADLGADATVRNGGKGRIKVLDGNYLFESRLTFNAQGFGKLQFVGEGQPIITMGYNTVSPTDGFAPLIWVAGSAAVSGHTPLTFENIMFDGDGQTNGICLFQSSTSSQPMIEVKQCTFVNWVNTLWWTERTCPRWFHHNQVVNCDFPASNGAFWFDTTTVGPSMIHNNVFESCSGNMVWGFAFADHAYFDLNVQPNGTMVLNALAGVNYTNNYGF